MKINTGKILFLLTAGLLASTGTGFSQNNKLEILQDNYPRAGYFRVAEATVRQEYPGKYNAYKAWRAQFSDLEGIMGKTEYEELLRNNPHDQIYTWFKRYKKDFPEKMVLVHMNGRGRIPNYRLEKFSPGHWQYFVGSEVNCEVAGENDYNYSEETWLDVEVPTNFSMNNGSKRRTPDDITLVSRKEDGSLDWTHAEYVRLLEIKGNRIKVQRAMFGSEALHFKAGKTYAAPHLMGGPWGSTVNMVWYYNLSTECPKDENGKTCADILVEEISKNFAKGGKWETFDGVQFDVMTGVPTTGYHPNRREKGQTSDINMDGVQDDGMIDGVQTYGLGCFEYLNRLRAAVPAEKFLLADGREFTCQRSGNQVLNGVEMEGVPEQRPYGFVTWSATYNLLNQWKKLAKEPLLNYSAFRYNNPDKLTEEEICQYYRLAFAQGCFTDSFLMCNSWTDVKAKPELRKVFGLEEGEPLYGWLGKPTAGTVHLNDTYPYLFHADTTGGWKHCSHGISITSDYKMEQGEDGKLTVLPGEGPSFSLSIKDIPYSSGQAYIEIHMKSCGKSSVYPEGYNRSMTLSVDGVKQRFMTMPMTLTDQEFAYRIYFCDSYDYMTDKLLEFDPDHNGKIDVRVTVADNDRPFQISEISVKDAPEIIIRTFEHGTVIANLSQHPFREQTLGVTVPGKDALFIRN